MGHCVFKDVFSIYLKCKNNVEVNLFRTLTKVPGILQDVFVVSAKNVTLELVTVFSYMI